MNVCVQKSEYYQERPRLEQKPLRGTNTIYLISSKSILEFRYIILYDILYKLIDQ